MSYLFKVFKTLLWSFSMKYWLITLRQRGLVSILPFAHTYQIVSQFPIVWYMLFRSSLSIYWIVCLSYVFSQKSEGEFLKLGVLMLLCLTGMFILHIYQFEYCSWRLMVFPTSWVIASNYRCIRPLSLFTKLNFRHTIIHHFKDPFTLLNRPWNTLCFIV